MFVELFELACFRLPAASRLMIGLLVLSFCLLTACSSTSQNGAGPQKQSIYAYTGHSGIVLAVAWSPDGKRIASAGADGTVQVWDAFTGKGVLVIHGSNPLPDGNPASINALAWSPDGKYLASGGDDHTVRVWNAMTGRPLVIYRGHRESVYAVAWSPNSKRLASGGGDIGGSDHTVQVWDAFTGKQIFIYRGHKDVVQTVAWSSDGRFIASGASGNTAISGIPGGDHTVRVWNAVTGVDIAVYRGHSGPVLALAWSPDGTRIVSTGFEHSAFEWDATTAKTILTYTVPGIGEAIAWSPDGKQIAVGGSAEVVQVWDAATGRDIATYRGHTDFIHALAWSPDGKYLASGASDHTIRIWPSPSGK